MKAKGSTNPSVENSCVTASSSVLSLTAEICCQWRNLPSSPYSRNSNFWVEIWPMILHYWRSYVLWSCGPIQGTVKCLNDKNRWRLVLFLNLLVFKEHSYFVWFSSTLFLGLRESVNLPVLYRIVSKTASSNTTGKKQLTALKLDKCWGGNLLLTIREWKVYFEKGQYMHSVFFCGIKFVSLGLQTT